MKEKNNSIIFIAHDFSKTEGGVNNFIRKIFNETKKNNFKPSIISLHGKNEESKEGHVYLKAIDVFDEPIISPISLKKVMPIIKKSEIVHFNSMFTFISLMILIFVYLLNKNIIITFHGMFDIEGSGKVYRIFSLIRGILIINFSFILSKKIVFLTKAQMTEYNNLFLFKKKIKKDKFVVIPNFIEKNRILSKKVVKKNCKLIFVGRLSKLKGFYDLTNLPDSFYKETDLLIAGGKRLNNLPLKNNMQYLGIVSPNKINSYYDKASIFILPSYTEAFPMTILEAMARGLVILVSDIPGMREIVKEGRNGYFFKPGDIKRMEGLILYLKNNPKEIKRISKNNLKDIRKFVAEKQIPKYLKVYKEVLKSNAKPDKK